MPILIEGSKAEQSTTIRVAAYVRHPTFATDIFPESLLLIEGNRPFADQEFVRFLVCKHGETLPTHEDGLLFSEEGYTLFTRHSLENQEDSYAVGFARHKPYRRIPEILTVERITEVAIGRELLHPFRKGVELGVVIEVRWHHELKVLDRRPKPRIHCVNRNIFTHRYSPV